MKKVLGMTAIRSDYDLMSGLFRRFVEDPSVDFKVLVSGAHLSRSFGYSVDLIKRDGLPILAQLETLIDGDSPGSRLKTASVLLQTAIDVVAAWAPDVILLAGDREDVLIGAMLGTYLRIPTVHFFGGDHERDGHSDTAVRHATSKLATMHAVSTQEHRERLIRMGEAPERIRVLGSIALDKFISTPMGSIDAVASRFPPGKRLAGYALVIFHPVDAEAHRSGEYFERIILALRGRGIPVCASYPNTDPGNSQILEVIRKYESEPDCWFYKNLERNQFLSLYKHSRFLIGNSSSGIQEAASIPLAAINVGLRQRGRMAGGNVVFCEIEGTAIGEAIEEVCSPAFQASLATIENPYGDGQSVEAAQKFILETDFAKFIGKTEDPFDTPLDA